MEIVVLDQLFSSQKNCKNRIIIQLNKVYLRKKKLFKLIIIKS